MRSDLASGSPFRAWAEFVVRRPRTVAAVVLAGVAVLGAQLPKLRLEIEERNVLPQQHPYVRLYNRINDQFGGGAVVAIGIVPRSGDVFQPAVLAKLERITRRVEARGSVASLAAARVKAVRMTADGIDVAPLMPEVPRAPKRSQPCVSR